MIIEALNDYQVTDEGNTVIIRGVTSPREAAKKYFSQNKIAAEVSNACEILLAVEMASAIAEELTPEDGKVKVY